DSADRRRAAGGDTADATDREAPDDEVAGRGVAVEVGPAGGAAGRIGPALRALDGEEADGLPRHAIGQQRITRVELARLDRVVAVRQTVARGHGDEALGPRDVPDLEDERARGRGGAALEVQVPLRGLAGAEGDELIVAHELLDRLAGVHDLARRRVV